MQPNTQDGNIKVKFMLRILEMNHVGSETGSGSETNWKVPLDPDKKKIIPGHW